jgi:diacylglycerol kinase family enzyme
MTGTAVEGNRAPAPPMRSRLAASAALIVALATLALLVVFTVENVLYVLASLACGLLAISTLWVAATDHRLRWWAAPAAAIFVGGAIASLVAAGRSAVAIIVVLVGTLSASALATLAMRWEVYRIVARRWRPVPPAQHGVILVNPKSGDGKAARLHLADEAHRLGIETVILDKGDDLRSLAEKAVEEGADALGMAGGDGSQAIVASVAADRGVAFVCIPTGTRNHLALDLGIDRDHPLQALKAFGPAREASVDLAEVNGLVFVNNVSLGVYAGIVASDQYREAKRRTVAELLPGMFGPGAPSFGLVIGGPDGPVPDACVIEVSNNVYRLSSVAGFGSRPRLDGGALGVTTLSVHGAPDVDRLVALQVAGHPERFEGWRQWTSQDLVVGGLPALAAAVDGEARKCDPPLHFRIRPGVLRARIAPGEPGASPALLHAPMSANTFAGLVRIVFGKPSGIPLGQGTAPAAPNL